MTSISPPRAISLLNHSLGVTAEEHISFGPDLKGGTRIRITLDLVGKSSELSEAAIEDAVTFMVRDALDTVVAVPAARLWLSLVIPRERRGLARIRRVRDPVSALQSSSAQG